MAFVDSCVGQRFGRLTVISVELVPEKKRRMARCACDCGQTRTVDPRMLKRGDTTSCGCLHKEQLSLRRSSALVGQVFGRLTVLEKAERKLIGTRQRSNLAWLCQCSCGTQVTLTSNALSSGNTQSCGCLNKERLVETRQKEATYLAQASKMLAKAAIRGKEWTIQLEDAALLIQGSCHYCGKEPVARGRAVRLKYHGIDRLDSAIGYVPGNVVACCSKCNYAKNTMSTAELTSHVTDMYNFLTKKVT